MTICAPPVRPSVPRMQRSRVVAPGSRTILAAAVACFLAGGAALAATTDHGNRTLDKKLIQYGWGIPTPEFIRANVREMEKRPFDGLIFQLKGGRRILDPKPWPETKFAQDFDHCKAIDWKVFTHNFVIMLAASEQDWFNDEHWTAIDNNVRLVARGARLARCKGVCFDQEPYGGNPWAYSRAQHREAKSFAEYEAKARERGAQFIRAVEAELPGATIMTFFQLSYFDSICGPMEPAERAGRLSTHQYSLLPAFLNGILDAASADVRIVDGNERAYYYTSSEPYFRNYQSVTQRGLLLVDPKNREKYRRQMQVGNALYIDQYFGLRVGRKVLGHFLDLDERPKWFEHNVYWALYTADQYVWCYSERMHWFRNEGIPPGCEEAIRSARGKIDAGEALAIDMRPIVERGSQREQAALAERLKRRSAVIGRLPTGTPTPTVDAALDDDAWKKKEPLPPLLALAANEPKLGAQTQVWVTYDDTALYVAIRCEEPQVERMQIAGEKHDEPLWNGEDVEVMVAPPGKTAPFYHFMLNPRGVHWDGLNGDSNTLSYNPAWQHAARIGAAEWTAEMAIPWSALEMSVPAPGTQLRANVCRQRRHARELSAWSPMARGFLEHEFFGTWTFR